MNKYRVKVVLYHNATLVLSNTYCFNNSSETILFLNDLIHFLDLGRKIFGEDFRIISNTDIIKIH